MAAKFARILNDIEEALAREVRRIIFFETRDRTPQDIAFREMFDPFTGELVKKPIEPKFYDDTADATISTSPRFSIRLLKLYEDLETGRLLPPYGNEIVSALPGHGAYKVVLAGEAVTTNGGGGSIIEFTDRRILDVTTSHFVRILEGANTGTYHISSIALNEDGPHTITLSNDLITGLPQFDYNKDAGIVTFRDFVDLQTVKSGDSLVDISLNSFVITAVNAFNSTLAIAPGSAVVNGTGAKIVRSGDVLQNDDAGEAQCFLILDPSQPILGKGTRYEVSSQLIPYTFLYFIKISSRERDDHISVANRMMQVFNPPRGSLFVVVRMDNSFESELLKDSSEGDKIIYVKDASKFYVNDRIRLFDNLDVGEDAVVDSVNQLSNSITLRSPISKMYTADNCARLLSNHCIAILERDFRNHVTEDKEDSQFWIHRFTYRIEGWVDSRIPPYTTEQVSEYQGDVNFIGASLEDFEGNVLDDNLLVP